MIFTVMPMFVCLFWTTLLALDLLTGKRSRNRLLLTIFMLTATVLYFGHCAFFNHNTPIIPLTDTLYSIANLAVYPLYYLYICALTLRRGHLSGEWGILVPAIFAGITVGSLYAMMSDEETRLFIHQYLYEGERSGLIGLAAWQAYVHDICKALFAILIIPVFFLGSKHIKRYDTLVRNAYADTENKTLTKMQQMMVAFIITSILSFVANIIGRDRFADSLWLLAIPSTLFSLMLFTIGYIGYHQQFSIEDIENDEQRADAQLTSQIGASELRARIERLMEEEQLYRQPNFKIVDLVNRLNTNRNYIYQALNIEMGLSFSEYINRMRIEYAAMLIAQQPNKSLSEIAEIAGFTSNTSFYRNFKLYKGIAPKEYQNTQRKE